MNLVFGIFCIVLVVDVIICEEHEIPFAVDFYRDLCDLYIIFMVVNPYTR